ncbi:nuclear transport factor 2 family protein [Henriciella litoralis]|uniref:nuclear transport factor 2 family protein n=1 Tax=Henriciella litoralis TaxID=568102 RepID=UPI00146D0978|nr:nuclear transport factor 2 family protein [Henriciella litoralis]
MDEMQRALIEKQCEGLSIRFANYVDQGRAEDVANLFSDDGSFSRAGQVLDGPDQLRAFLEKRPSARVTRHICTNIEVNVVGPTEATGVTYFLLFDGSREADSEGPLPLMSPAALGEYHDTFVLTPEGWRIKERSARAVFRKAEG